MIHKSVLLHETINGLDIQSEDIVVDGTLGGGGHSEEILRSKSPKMLICLDLDQEAIVRSKKRLKELSGNKVLYFNENFKDLDLVLEGLNIKSVDKILLDLGLSSHQLELSERGFTFQKDEPLEMTFKKVLNDENQLTAYDVVNGFQEENLRAIIYGFGEERFSRRIAKKIVEYRKIHKIRTTFELAEIVKTSVPYWYKKGNIHPATKTFQAIRIAVNDELGNLERGIKRGFELLSEEGRLAVISFHSLEDRVVKDFFKLKNSINEGQILTKKPITPTKEEITHNPRARSSKLRIIKKISKKQEYEQGI